MAIRHHFGDTRKSVGGMLHLSTPFFECNSHKKRLRTLGLQVAHFAPLFIHPPSLSLTKPAVFSPLKSLVFFVQFFKEKGFPTFGQNLVDYALTYLNRFSRLTGFDGWQKIGVTKTGIK